MTSSKERQKKFIARQLEEGRKKKSYFVKDAEERKIKKVLGGMAYVLDLAPQSQAAPLIIAELEKIEPREIIQMLVRELIPQVREHLLYTISEMREMGLIKEEKFVKAPPVPQTEVPVDNDPQWKYRCELIMQKIEEDRGLNGELTTPGRRKLEEMLYALGELNPKTGKKFEGKTIRRYMSMFYPDLYKGSYEMESSLD